jgi:hypothetical protein
LACCQARRNSPISSSADEREICPRRFDFLFCFFLALAGDAPDLDRLGDALERMCAERFAGEEVADKIVGSGAGKECVGAGEGLQTGGEVGGLADHGLLARRAFADGPAAHEGKSKPQQFCGFHEPGEVPSGLDNGQILDSLSRAASAPAACIK